MNASLPRPAALGMTGRNLPRRASLLIGLACGLVFASQAHAQAAYTTYDLYDANQRLVGEIDPSPTANYPAVRHTYDSLGRETLTEHGYLSAWPGTSLAPASWSGFTVLSSEATSYDSYNRKVQSQALASGATIAITQYSYDVVGRPTCTTIRMNLASPPAAGSDACTLGTAGSSGSDRVTKLLYDQYGRVTQERHGVGTNLEQAYLTNSFGTDGELLTIVDANGNQTTNTYDGFDRLVQINYPATTLGSLTSNASDYEAYTLDPEDNRLTDRRRDGVTLTFTYDALKRVLSKTVPAPSGGSVVTNTTYDLQSHPLAVTYASTGTGVVYAYDGAGRTTGEATFGKSVAYAYDADSDLVSLTWPDGQIQSFAYDAADRTTSTSSAAVPASVTESFSYDPAGRLTGITRPNGFSTTITLDGAGRLTALAHAFSNAGYNASYGVAYTPAGQAASRTLSNTAYLWPSALVQNQARAADGLNRDAAIASVAGGYDARGNLTFDGTRRFTYDEENRLLTESGPATAALSYDPLGRLSGAVINGAVTNFLYSGSKLVAEYDGSGNVLRRYFHGVGVDSPDIWIEGAAVTAANANFLIKDRQGSVIGAVNTAGTETAVYRYGPYGEPDAWGGSRFRYTGQIELPELQLYHYKARVYDPTMARFLQTDPIGYKDGPDWYLYVHDDPLNHSDPAGTDTISADFGGELTLGLGSRVAVGGIVSFPGKQGGEWDAGLTFTLGGALGAKADAGVNVAYGAGSARDVTGIYGSLNSTLGWLGFQHTVQLNTNGHTQDNSPSGALAESSHGTISRFPSPKLGKIGIGASASVDLKGAVTIRSVLAAVGITHVQIDSKTGIVSGQMTRSDSRIPTKVSACIDPSKCAH